MGGFVRITQQEKTDQKAIKKDLKKIENGLKQLKVAVEDWGSREVKTGLGLVSESGNGEWKLKGMGKHTIKPLQKNGFGPPPPPMINFPPRVCSRPVIFLTGNWHRPDQSHFLRPPKLVLKARSFVRFPPPPKKNRAIRFALPICRFPTISAKTEQALTFFSPFPSGFPFIFSSRMSSQS